MIRRMPEERPPRCWSWFPDKPVSVRIGLCLYAAVTVGKLEMSFLVEVECSCASTRCDEICIREFPIVFPRALRCRHRALDDGTFKMPTRPEP